MKEYLKQIENVKKGLSLGMQPRTTNKKILELCRKVKKYFGIDIPNDFIEILRTHNGVEFSGLQIYGTTAKPIEGNPDRQIEGLIEANQLWHEIDDNKNYVFYGDDDLSLYGINLSSGEYEEIDKTTGDVFDTSESISSLLGKSIKIRLDSMEK